MDQAEKMKETHGLIDWWVGTVIFAFFPIIVSMVISLLNTANVNIERMIGDGELILSAFAISAPTLIHHFNEKNRVHKILFYGLFISAFLQLVVYTTIKTNVNNDFIAVLIASLLCVSASVFISWKSEVFFKGV